MVDFTRVPPLDWQTPIVDPKTGQPSAQFIRLWQQTFQNAEGSEGQLSQLSEAVEDVGVQIDEVKEVDIIAGTALDGGGSLGDAPADITINHADSTVAPDTYGSSTLIPVITVDQQGHVTSVTEETVEGLPAGGTTGQVLGKASNTDYDVEWVNQTGGGSGGNWWFSPPVAADFSTLVSGGGGNLTLTDDPDVGLIFSSVKDATGDRQRIAVKALPSGGATAWTVTSRICSNTSGANSGVWLTLYENTSGKTVLSGIFAVGSAVYNQQVWRSTAGTLNGYTAVVINQFAVDNYAFLRVAFNGSNTYTFSWSLDGKTFTSIGTLTSTTGFTTRATHIGLGVSVSVNNGVPVNGYCDHWTQSW